MCRTDEIYTQWQTYVIVAWPFYFTIISFFLSVFCVSCVDPYHNNMQFRLLSFDSCSTVCSVYGLFCLYQVLNDYDLLAYTELNNVYTIIQSTMFACFNATLIPFCCAQRAFGWVLLFRWTHTKQKPCTLFISIIHISAIDSSQPNRNSFPFVYL